MAGGFQKGDHGGGWTEERVAMLKQHFADGLSSGESGKLLGVSRNSVIGKRLRMGLVHGEAQVKLNRARGIVTRSIGMTGRPPSAASTPADSPHTGAVVDLLDLGPCRCRWPIGTPGRAGFGFCGRSTGGTYCAEHARRAHAPSKPAAQAKRSGVDELARMARRFA